MIQTPNLGLEKYEPTDAANLIDGYNSSMDTLDTFAGEHEAHFPVKTNDIADNAITGAKLNNGSVTTDKIVDANVTPSKLAAGAAAANIGKGGVTSSMLAAGAAAANIGKGGVTSDMLAANITTKINKNADDINNLVTRISNIEKALDTNETTKLTVSGLTNAEITAGGIVVKGKEQA